jgi:hypothetical protein
LLQYPSCSITWVSVQTDLVRLSKYRLDDIENEERYLLLMA